MSDSFWKNLSTISGLFVLGAIFLLLTFVANLEIKDLDLWLHLGMGRYIVQNGFHVPAADMLSCTVAGTPWVNHEWLFQVIVYSIHDAFGPEGLINMQIILVASTLLILTFLGYSRDKQLGAVFVLLLVSLVYQNRFTIRPDLYSLLFFALYIFLLSFFLERKWSLYVLFVIQIIWSNMHGFFFFGPLFVLIGLSAEWIKRHVKLPYHWNKTGRLTNDEYRRLKMILGAVLLACLINPLTFKGAWYPISVFFQITGESQIFFDKIIELRRPISWATLFDTSQYPYYKLLIVLSFMSFVYNRKRIDIGVLFFWVAFLFFSLSAIRNLVFFAFAAYLVFVTNALSLTLRDIVPFRITDKKFVHIVSTFVKVLIIIWIVQYGANISMNGYFDYDKYERKSEFGGISLRAYPNKAVDFLVDNEVKGNFFNDFNTGAYLVGRCSPNIKVFIDGRTEVYGPKFFKYYQKLWEFDDESEFAAMLDKYQMTGALMNSVHQPIPEHALYYLYTNEEWVPVYFDYDAVIFLKDVPQNKFIIEKHRLDLANWSAKQLDLRRLGARSVIPYHNINRAYTLKALDLNDAALAEATAALAVDPRSKEAYKIRGRIFGKRKDFQQAFENFRIAATLAPRSKSIRKNLAQAYYDLEEYEYAVDQYKRMMEYWPNDPQSYFLVARAYTKQQLYDKAIAALKHGCTLDPRAVESVLKIGDMILDDENYLLAKEVYALVLNKEKDQDKVHHKLSVVYQRLGDDVKAREELEQALRIAPDSEMIKDAMVQLNAILP